MRFTEAQWEAACREKTATDIFTTEHNFCLKSLVCIYCNRAACDQHIDPQPCKRIMEPFVDDKDDGT